MNHQRSSLNARGPRGRLTVALPLTAVAAVAVLAAGCGAESSGAGSVTAQETTPATDLTIAVTDGDTTTWTLTCDPVGGDHPDADAACATLDKSGDQAVPAASTDQMCTQIFGGEQTATITGTWKGKAIDASFSRENGCEIARWDLLTPLLPKVTGSQAS
ncbi:hypothetical protein KIH74_19625 [Kineosporia sp. J2-2]|uniref:Subtilisin inhibitor domain-containing protein n=1 Tax=Kineosporia corallincola TaxID=2835133 RepID=A0ABS5TJG6_9ACTN|nr:SSI family serine proteinase inhibitor [Kineosporia corallincola]MBT0771160.1 hypothetical protein [Kineosporia corallincola]